MEPCINGTYITAVSISVDGKYIRSKNWPGSGRFWTLGENLPCESAPG